MKIGLVARCLNTNHVRGMGKYVYEVIKQLDSYPYINWFLFANDKNKPMTIPSGENIQEDVFEFKGDRFQLWEQIGLPLRAIKHRVDVLHCTESTLPLWQPIPTVVTVHDTLMWEDIPDNCFARYYFNRLLPDALHKCTGIITISESSKRDILTKWPALESKLTVIPHGIDEEYFTDQYLDIPKTVKAYIGGSPYVVYLGGALERKRFSWALSVLANYNATPLKLVACGFGDEARRDAMQKLPSELRDRVHFAEFLSDADLLALYKNAQAVFYPTLYEGFGFPAVEAQAAGVPVFFSALGSLTELIGPLAMVLPPNDLNAWSNALSEVVSMDARTRRQKAQAAQIWAKKFAWSESAKKHLAVYQEAAKITIKQLSHG